MSRLRILIVDDERILARSIKLFLEEQGHEAEAANDGERALELLEKLRPDLVFLDLRLPGLSGLELLKRIRAHDPAIVTIVMTAYGTIEGAVEAMKLGSFDYVTKPVDLDELRLIVERAQEDRRLRQEVRYYRDREARNFDLALVGRCPAMQKVLADIERLASLDDAPPVLLTGETGTGKSLVARALHARGRRSRGPFIEVDCTSLPPSLIETELFGYEKGSFTDARESRIGLIEAAEGGTCFLDEVGDLELALQGKLLRAIDERTVRRVGSVRDRKVDAWIIAATNKDLAEMLAAGSFRKDLYYRLAVVTISLPPLRERKEDVELLAAFFLKRYSAKYGRRLARVSPASLASFEGYDWPGNLRELGHSIERAVLASPADASELDADAIGTPAKHGAAVRDEASAAPPRGLSLADSERAMIERALLEANGNQTRAAQLLGITRDTLRYRMAKFRIAP
jgi:two-component system, NtrC family, response regulator AtoC